MEITRLTLYPVPFIYVHLRTIAVTRSRTKLSHLVFLNNTMLKKLLFMYNSSFSLFDLFMYFFYIDVYMIFRILSLIVKTVT